MGPVRLPTQLCLWDGLTSADRRTQPRSYLVPGARAQGETTPKERNEICRDYQDNLGVTENFLWNGVGEGRGLENAQDKIKGHRHEMNGDGRYDGVTVYVVTREE